MEINDRPILSKFWHRIALITENTPNLSTLYENTKQLFQDTSATFKGAQ
jgi:hypothetical protein